MMTLASDFPIYDFEGCYIFLVCLTPAIATQAPLPGVLLLSWNYLLFCPPTAAPFPRLRIPLIEISTLSPAASAAPLSPSRSSDPGELETAPIHAIRVATARWQVSRLIHRFSDLLHSTPFSLSLFGLSPVRRGLHCFLSPISVVCLSIFFLDFSSARLSHRPGTVHSRGL